MTWWWYQLLSQGASWRGRFWKIRRSVRTSAVLGAGLELEGPAARLYCRDCPEESTIRLAGKCPELTLEGEGPVGRVGRSRRAGHPLGSGPLLDSGQEGLKPMEPGEGRRPKNAEGQTLAEGGQRREEGQPRRPEAAEAGSSECLACRHDRFVRSTGERPRRYESICRYFFFPSEFSCPYFPLLHRVV